MILLYVTIIGIDQSVQQHNLINGYAVRAYIRVGIHIISFLFLHENICCGYSLEAPRQGTSNEYHNICFHGEIKKISAFSEEKNALSVAMGIVASMCTHYYKYLSI